ncbi:sorbosone dehydrogenase family protein [Pedobacter sp. SYSU D00535]|uniref:PQQ-dependent sugar dehydrogenase n=1 Tax=Pedobacter sp. SYSU D00535 TaxID=2810308 RepID=UPI001A9681DE|nr:sorbosone dehydrogenase family protein [Pedobacter sp. SYSU D00535]
MNVLTTQSGLIAACLLTVSLTVSCGGSDKKQIKSGADTVATIALATGEITLPEPDTTASKTKYSEIIGWPEGRTPVAPEGFSVTRYADGFQSPRWIYQAPNGDIFIAEAATEHTLKKRAKDMVTGKAKSQQQEGSANRITLLRDANQDGKPELKTIFLTGLKQPLGMLILNNSFYVANTNGVVQYPYTPGQTRMTAKGKKILELTADGYNNHWTRNLIASPDGSKIYVSVGSASNYGEHGMEHEIRRANILEINRDGTQEKVFASGLRNPVGMDWYPGSNTLWTAVNERDGLGDELVPDYLTSVKEGGFYGWPYAYFGQNEDPRLKGVRPDLVKKTIVPDVALGSHTASLGLAFYDQKAFPNKYHNGAFIGQHGSWNHSQLVGYKVVFVPFRNGRPAGKPEDFLTGFVANQEDGKVYGRPVGVAVLRDGSLLVADDASNVIWRVAAEKK